MEFKEFVKWCFEKFPKGEEFRDYKHSPDYAEFYNKDIYKITIDHGLQRWQASYSSPWMDSYEYSTIIVAVEADTNIEEWLDSVKKLQKNYMPILQKLSYKKMYSGFSSETKLKIEKITKLNNKLKEYDYSEF